MNRNQDVSDYPTEHRTAPYNKELFGTIANSAEVKKPWRERETVVGKLAREVNANQVFWGTREADSEILMERYTRIAREKYWK